MKNMDHFPAATNLTNRIIEDILALSDVESKVKLTEDINKVRYQLFDILDRLKQAQTVSPDNVLPEAVIMALWNPKTGKLEVNSKSVDEYCETAFGDVNQYNSDIYMLSYEMLTCFVNRSGKYMTSEVSFSNVHMDKYLIPKFIVRLG